MKIAKLGEFALIENIKRWVRNSPDVLRGIGDDCAVVKYTKDKYMLLCCDMLVERVDFTEKTPAVLIGRKAIALSISDIAAKGGVPQYALVALGLPGNKTDRFVREIYRGMDYWAKKFKINIVGGDISKAARLVIDVAMVGFVEKNNLVLRSGAKNGDIIFVSGSLGGSIFGKHLSFKPRLEEARYLVKNYRIHAMIDISDGLSADLGHILTESKTGAIIYERLIPLSKKCQSFNNALQGGEDFELLFTLSLKEAKRLLGLAKRRYTAIGEIRPQDFGLRLVDGDYREKILRPKGFVHF